MKDGTHTLSICNEESVDFDIPAVINIIGCIGVRCRRRRECLREVLLALTLIVDWLDEPADNSRLASWRALLEVTDFVADDPFP